MPITFFYFACLSQLCISHAMAQNAHSWSASGHILIKSSSHCPSLLLRQPKVSFRNVLLEVVSPLILPQDSPMNNVEHIVMALSALAISFSMGPSGLLQEIPLPSGCWAMHLIVVLVCGELKLQLNFNRNIHPQTYRVFLPWNKNTYAHAHIFS